MKYHVYVANIHSYIFNLKISDDISIFTSLIIGFFLVQICILPNERAPEPTETSPITEAVLVLPENEQLNRSQNINRFQDSTTVTTSAHPRPQPAYVIGPNNSYIGYNCVFWRPSGETRGNAQNTTASSSSQNQNSINNPYMYQDCTDVASAVPSRNYTGVPEQSRCGMHMEPEVVSEDNPSSTEGAVGGNTVINDEVSFEFGIKSFYFTNEI